MDRFLQHVYVREVQTQCQFAINAVRSLNHALQQVGRGRELSTDERMAWHSEVFRHTHSFLTHASNISRLFWPPSVPKRKGKPPSDYVARAALTSDRGESLRALFSLTDVSPLKDRTLRDHLEHYDERLDDWQRTSKNRNIASDNIGPRGAISGLSETDQMRWFDPTTNRFSFRGEEYDLQELATSVDRLLPLAAELLSQLRAPRHGA
jgi:hypothetical protein